MNRFLPLVTAAAVAALSLTTPAYAGKYGHDHSKDSATHDTANGHGDQQHFDKKVFNGVKDAWAFIKMKVAEADQLLAEKKIGPVHEIGEQLVAAVNTMQSKSDMVSGDAKAKLSSILTQLEKAADELHHSAEKGDADATALGLKKVKGLLPVVQSLYPTDVL